MGLVEAKEKVLRGVQLSVAEAADLIVQVERLKEEGSAADFACHLIDHCEGEVVTEEFVRHELMKYLTGMSQALKTSIVCDYRCLQRDDPTAASCAKCTGRKAEMVVQS